MTPPRDDSGNYEPSDENLSVKIALAVEQPDAPGDCPSDVKLAALIDGRLDDHQRAALWEHLDACNDCYQTWLLATEDLESQTSSQHAGHRKTRIYRFGAMAAAAIFAFIMVYLNWPALFYTDTGALLANAYGNLLDSRKTFDKKVLEQMVPLPWQDSNHTFGFNNRSGNAPANLAFGAGLLTGRKRLADSKTESALPDFLSSAPYASGADDAWHKTDHKEFFQLGQWCVLLVAACKSPADTLPNGFWKQQPQIAEKLKEAIQTKSYGGDNQRIATAGIGALGKNLVKMSTTPKKKRTCIDISAQAMKLIQFLSPVEKHE